MDHAPFAGTGHRILHLVVGAAPSAAATVDLIDTEQADGWDVRVIATPAATLLFDVTMVEERTGHRVRVGPTAGPALPDNEADHAVLLAPGDFDTINKWAAGHHDSAALQLLNEAIGRRLKIEVRLDVSELLRRHPVFDLNRSRLEALHVRFGPDADARTATTSPDGVFSCAAVKRGWVWAHTDCRFEVSRNGIVFTDREDDQHSFHLALEQLGGATLTTVSAEDLRIELADGEPYEVGFDNGDGFAARAALRRQLVAAEVTVASDDRAG